MKSVSVIIPVFNMSGKLSRCVESVRAQSYDDIQIILVNDGSTDNSAELCQRFAEKDRRILFISKENGGVSSARNAGLDHSIGDYVMFVDADDYVFPEYVETYLGIAESQKADLVIGGLIIDEQGYKNSKTPQAGTYDKKSFVDLLCTDGTEIYGYACNKLFKRNLIEEYSLRFKEGVSSQEDLDFTLSFVRHACCLCCTDYCGYKYYYSAPMRSSKADSILENQITLYKIAVDLSSDPTPVVARFQRMLYSFLYHADSVSEIERISIIPEISRLLYNIPAQRKEIRLIIKWFSDNKHRSVYYYFKCRHRLRRILNALHLVKEVE